MQVCGRSVGIVHLFWVFTVEGSGYFVRYCGVLMECREKGSKFVVSEIFFLGGELWYFFF